MTRTRRVATAAAPKPRELATYLAKRDATKTPEPMASPHPKRRARTALPIFVIQEHHASSLHWDFRLEHEGVLASWALPKGLPMDTRTNHLAVPTEDHPFDYAKFEGVIPEGEYGAGQVSIWDHGTYDLELWREDEVKFELHGSRATGHFALFRTGEKRWMIHRMDPIAKDFVAMPDELAPMLAVSGSLPTSKSGWSYEFKWDGVRAVLFVDGGRVRAMTRNGRNIVTNFPELREIGAFLGSRSAVLDGEIVALDSEGRPSFAALSHRLHVTSAAQIKKLSQTTPATFFAFDLMYLEGSDLTGHTYDERRAALESLHLEGESFVTPPSFTTSGKRALAISRERRLEGVVAKRRDSRYAPGQRSPAWVKVKNFLTQEVVIGGWTQGKGERTGSLGSLLVGIPTDGGLVYAGKVGTGMSAETRDDILRRLGSRRRATSPFVEGLRRSEASEAHFVRPDLVGEVQFSEWTATGRLRHPSWRGFRSNKAPGEVRRES